MKKTLYILATVFLLIVTIGYGCLFTETGRGFLISQLMKHFFDNRVVMSVENMDKSIRNIGKLTLKTTDGVTVKISDIKVKRQGFFDIPYFEIENVDLNFKQAQKSDSQKSENKEATTEINHSEIISALKMVPLFTSGFEIAKFNANINDKKYVVEHVKYSAKEQKISLHSNEYGDLSAQLKISAMINADVKLIFKNCFDANGEIDIIHLLSKEKNYSAKVQSKYCDAKAIGTFSNPIEKINITQCDVVKGKDSIQLTGVAYPKDKKIDAQIPLILNKLPTITSSLNKLPKNIANQISGKIDGTIAYISSKLEDDYKTIVQLKNHDKLITKAEIRKHNGGAKVSMDLFNFDVVGYKISKIQGTILSDKISANVIGDILNINTQLVRKGDSFDISKCDISFPQIGSVKLKLPKLDPVELLKKKFSQFF